MRVFTQIIGLNLIAVQLACGSRAEAATKAWTLKVDEEMRERLVRIPVVFEETYDSGRLAVVEDGKRVACQVEVLKGTANQVVEGKIWVCVTAKKGETRKYEVTTGAEAQKFEPKVKVSKEGEEWVLDNGVLAIKLPAAAGKLEGPIGGVKVGDGWIGSSHWQSSTVFNSLQSRVTGDGTLFGQVELLYIFNDPTYGGRIPFASVTVRMPPGKRYVVVEESMAMQEGDRWVMDLKNGWDAGRHHFLSSTAKLNEEKEKPAGVAPDAELVATAVSNQTLIAGIRVTRSEDWENLGDVRIQLGKVGDALGFPTFRGARHWMLFAGPIETKNEMLDIRKGSP